METRGAEIYPLLMAWRHERAFADTAKLQTKIAHMIATWKREDELERDGRSSYPPIKPYLADRPWLNARVVGHDQTGTGKVMR